MDHSSSGMLTPCQIYGLARHCPVEELRLIDQYGIWNKLHDHQKDALRQARKENYIKKEPTKSIWWSQKQRCYLYTPVDLTLDPMQIVASKSYRTKVRKTFCLCIDHVKTQEYISAATENIDHKKNINLAMLCKRVYIRLKAFSDFSDGLPKGDYLVTEEKEANFRPPRLLDFSLSSPLDTDEIRNQLANGKFKFPVSIEYLLEPPGKPKRRRTDTIHVQGKIYPAALLKYAHPRADQQFYVRSEDVYHLFFYDPEMKNAVSKDDQDLRQLIVNMSRILTVGDQKKKKTNPKEKEDWIYHDAFSFEDAVSWICETKKIDHSAAIEFGNQAIEAELIESVTVALEKEKQRGRKLCSLETSAKSAVANSYITKLKSGLAFLCLEKYYKPLRKLGALQFKDLPQMKEKILSVLSERQYRAVELAYLEPPKDDQLQRSLVKFDVLAEVLVKQKRILYSSWSRPPGFAGKGADLLIQVRDGSLQIECTESTRKLDLYEANIKFKRNNKQFKLTMTFDSEMKLPDDFNFRTVRFGCQDLKALENLHWAISLAAKRPQIIHLGKYVSRHSSDGSFTPVGQIQSPTTLNNDSEAELSPAVSDNPVPERIKFGTRTVTAPASSSAHRAHLHSMTPISTDDISTPLTSRPSPTRSFTMPDTVARPALKSSKPQSEFKPGELYRFLVGGKKPAKGNPVRSDRKRAQSVPSYRDSVNSPPSARPSIKPRHSILKRPRVSTRVSIGADSLVKRESSVGGSKSEIAVAQWNCGRANEWARHRNVTLISFCKYWEREGGEILSELAREYDMREAERKVHLARAALKKIEADELLKIAANRTPGVELVMAAVCLLLGKRGEWSQGRRLLKDPTFVEELEKTDVSLSEFIQLQRTKDKAETLLSKFPAELRKLGYLRRVYDWKAKTPAAAVLDTSKALEPLSNWCCAMYNYARVKQTQLLIEELQGSVPADKSKREDGYTLRNFKVIIEHVATSIPIENKDNWYQFSPLKAEHCDHPVNALARLKEILLGRSEAFAALCDASYEDHIADLAWHNARYSNSEDAIQEALKEKDRVQAEILKSKQGFNEACEEQSSLLCKVGRGGGASNCAKSFRNNKLNSQMSDMLVANAIENSVQEQFFYLLQRCYFVPAGIAEADRMPFLESLSQPRSYRPMNAYERVPLEHHFFIVLKGEVSVYKEHDEKYKLKLYPGGCFGCLFPDLHAVTGRDCICVCVEETFLKIYTNRFPKLLEVLQHRHRMIVDLLTTLAEDDKSGKKGSFKFAKKNSCDFRMDKEPEYQAGSKTPKKLVVTGGREYTFVKALGKGAYSTVWEVRANTGVIFAAKELQWSSDEDLRKASAEIKIIQNLRHKSIPKYEEAVLLDDDQLLYIIQEYCPGRPLISQEDLTDTKDHPLPLDQTWSVFRATLDCLEYLHESRIIHRDLKPDNILMCADGSIKIIDFGESEVGRKASTNAGTPVFMAPEVLGLVGHGDYLGTNADMYSLGVTLYTMVFGRLPFDTSNEADLYKAKQEDITFPLIDTSLVDYLSTEAIAVLSPAAPPDSPEASPKTVQKKSPEEEAQLMYELPYIIELLSSLISLDYKLRPSATELKNHPWVTKNGTMRVDI